ncbi:MULTISPECIES: hypothetical protein [Sphingobium]|uniref:hypothetical protein n=1 Tax=Sphingobium TaxID=165695 RepID=UPI0013EB84A7|nr:MULTISPECIES: hypothetical protein [Sphingobium]WDA39218.1 hypothetical protein PO876_00725 [Sphingobium sp. YC-XJ3]
MHRKPIQQSIDFTLETWTNIMKGKKKSFHDRSTPPARLRLSSAAMMPGDDLPVTICAISAFRPHREDAIAAKDRSCCMNIFLARRQLRCCSAGIVVAPQEKKLCAFRHGLSA